ncbi:hypothetical protein ACWGQT_12655 [Streptomyces yangpuensis]|uniref:Uncharacterized protein n=1 Tax=Streptomyces yangpuensis TaxID=1648182 RepID=A0ABY5Q4E3_9ACTN|nr:MULTISPECIES: hypothetical protein [Streptomyces]MBZ9598947.1 hypothetical protein [Streptomyces erythrochromogenes]UUY50723.1 hypothetical protein NRK68_27925 [Streptomyces yangpuensis]
MSATNAAERLGFAAAGALLAGGLLLAACTLPGDRPAPLREADGRARQGAVDRDFADTR